MSKYTTIRFEAGVYNNGCVRRVFVVLDNTRSGAIVATYRQGYAGAAAITNKYHRKAWQGLTFDTTVSEYKRLCQIGAK